MAVHAEIEYIDVRGDRIHSDICPPQCRFDRIDSEYRKLLHSALDEWLNKSNGTGYFYIANESAVELLNHIGEDDG